MDACRMYGHLVAIRIDRNDRRNDRRTDRRSVIDEFSKFHRMTDSIGRSSQKRSTIRSFRSDRHNCASFMKSCKKLVIFIFIYFYDF